MCRRCVHETNKFIQFNTWIPPIAVPHHGCDHRPLCRRPRRDRRRASAHSRWKDHGLLGPDHCPGDRSRRRIQEEGERTLDEPTPGETEGNNSTRPHPPSHTPTLAHIHPRTHVYPCSASWVAASRVIAQREWLSTRYKMTCKSSFSHTHRHTRTPAPAHAHTHAHTHCSWEGMGSVSR